MNRNEEKRYYDMVNRNICLACSGSGMIDDTKPRLMNNMCQKCLGNGKRFQNQLKDGILEV